MICVKGTIINEAEIKTACNYTQINGYGATITTGVQVTFKDGSVHESPDITTSDIMAEINKRIEEERKRQL